MSTTFYPGAILSPALAAVPTDLVIQSSDNVFFYCHLSLIRPKSSNNFNGLLPTTNRPSSSLSSGSMTDVAVAQTFIKTPFLTPIEDEDTPPMSPASSRSDGTRSSRSSLGGSGSDQQRRHHHRKESNAANPTTTVPFLVIVPETSSVVNVACHLLYNLSFEPYSPQLDVLTQVFPFIDKYGLSHHELTTSGSQLSTALLSFAPKHPLEVYTLAAQRNLHDLAVLSSQFTLSVSLSILTDQQAMDMGALYMKWLFFLHLGRAEALKRILVTPLDEHPADQPGATCNKEDRSALARAWGLVTAYILSNQGPQSVSVNMLRSTYGPLGGSVKCVRCKRMLEDQTERAVRNWSMVKCTI